MSRATSEASPSSRKFRPEFHNLLIDEIAGVRAQELGRECTYSVLSIPATDSPFLTVAESLGQEVPAYILKVLVVLEADAEAFTWWKKEVLDRERERLEAEFNRRLGMAFGQGAGLLEAANEPIVLPLPVSHLPGDGLVRVSATEYLDADLLLEGDRWLGEPPARFYYLVRPYVAWPSLRDVVLSERERRERWIAFCEQHGIRKKIAQSPACFTHFCHEALVSNNDLFLTTGWRWGLDSGGGNWLTRGLRSVRQFLRKGCQRRMKTAQIRRSARPVRFTGRSVPFSSARSAQFSPAANKGIVTRRRRADGGLDLH